MPFRGMGIPQKNPNHQTPKQNHTKEHENSEIWKSFSLVFGVEIQI